MKLRLIAEDSTKKERKALRWGLSFLVGDVLFDTFGRADVFWENIRSFRIDLSSVKHIVLSHEDWDHIDALGGFLRTHRAKTPVFLCERSCRKLKNFARENGGKVVEVAGPRRIAPGIFSLGQMRAATGRGILYEQALIVKTGNGFSVITGCAHPGIGRIVRQAIRLFGKKIYAVCGGFHMKDNPSKENQRIIEELQSLGIKKIIPLHCTGAKACRSFQKAYKNDCVALREGQTVEL